MGTFTATQIVYTARGQRCEYVAEIEGRHIVKLGRIHMEDGDDFETFDELAIISQVFGQEPVDSIGKEVTALTEKRNLLKTEVDAIKKVHNDVFAREGDLLARVSRNDALKRIADFIDGNFTHFVVVNYHGITIETKEQALTEKDNGSGGYSRKEMRLMTLFGNTKGDMLWRINYYSDGSGSATEAIPCTSLQEARDIAGTRFDQRWRNWRDDPAKHNVGDYAKSAELLGITVPDDVVEWRRQMQINALVGRVEIADAQKLAAEKELLALTKTAASG